ncbi:MAG TPA: OmpH family outer membrane protein [Paludibacteraceae bacterium]|mgnify:FL=1|jgi:outer membrane protein|nr:OmpH family outer membrane protein [Paludibacteraceae bacterium]MDS1031667.1 OmpH family outer membrane protein [Porphyromonadaceae sp. NP-X]NLJ20908.1 OmpH family outer membrane protein [Bacteroidales bacterium]MBP9017164.1 OmpH family outer membrane protein [Paludibacteraceae bacterium]HNZ61574.1 OmpH family outer membrane protein [Paludibacteraceae bacterium]
MFKKIAFLLLCIFPISLMGQEVKLGHINSQEILSLMPERAEIEKTLSDLQTQWENELVKMREEYYAKIKEFQDKQATMPESIKQARQSEIVEIEQRINTFNQTASSDLQKKQQELFAPVIDKVKKAINEVGAENNYTYIFDLSTQSIVYQSPKSNDVTALVKKKLGLK